MLDTELQDRPIPPHEKLVISKLPKIAPLIGDPGAVGEAAQLLVDASSPVRRFTAYTMREASSSPAAGD